MNAENVVESRNLSILQDHGTDWIVDDGLKPGGRIVVAGLQKAAPGATVTPEERQDPQEQAAAVDAAEGQQNAADTAPEAGGE